MSEHHSQPNANSVTLVPQNKIRPKRYRNAIKGHDGPYLLGMQKQFSWMTVTTSWPQSVHPKHSFKTSHTGANRALSRTAGGSSTTLAAVLRKTHTTDERSIFH